MGRPFYPPAALDRMRQTDERAMPDRCDRITPASGGGTNPDGSPAEDLPPVTTAGIPCRLSPLGGPEEAVYAARLQGAQGYLVALPLGTTVTEQDRLVVGGQTFEVIGVPLDSYATSVRAVCKDIA
jgi:hypothetical protein